MKLMKGIVQQTRQQLRGVVHLIYECLSSMNASVNAIFIHKFILIS